MVNINWLPPVVVAASERLAKAISLPDLAGSTVSLAVTGLSRSGKTVFTTSLIHNLLSAVHNPNQRVYTTAESPYIGRQLSDLDAANSEPDGGTRPPGTRSRSGLVQLFRL